MGSRRNETVNLAEAAELMDVHPNQVTRKLKEIGIRPYNYKQFERAHCKVANAFRFHRSDISTYLRHRDKVEDTHALKEEVAELTALIKSLGQRQDILEYTIGLRAERLPPNRQDVEERLLKCRYLLEHKFAVTTTALLEWSRFFFAATEAYFTYMALALKEEDPWVPFIHLADLLTISLSDRYAGSLEGTVAQECLELGRKNLRSVAYWCSVRKYGMKSAIEQVPQTHEGDVDEEIIAYILSRQDLKQRIKIEKDPKMLELEPSPE